MGDLRDDLAAALCNQHFPGRWDRAPDFVREQHLASADAVLAVLAGREAAAVAAVARARAEHTATLAQILRLAPGDDGNADAYQERVRQVVVRRKGEFARALDGAGDEPRPALVARWCTCDHPSKAHARYPNGYVGCSEFLCPCEWTETWARHLPNATPAEPAGDEPPTEPRDTDRDSSRCDGDCSEPCAECWGDDGIRPERSR